MAFKHFLLGFLTEQPMSGYSLYKHAFAPFRRPLSQIYRTLNKMMEEGLLEAERVVQDKLPNQNVYCLTEAGRAELLRWLREEDPENLSQIEMLAKLWLGGKVGREVVMRNLQSFEKQAREQLDYFNSKARPRVESRAEKRGHTLEDVYQKLTVDYGVRQLEVAVAWVEDALRTIQSFDSGEENIPAESERARVGPGELSKK